MIKETIEKAIEKINAEMQKDPDDSYIEIIGHYIIDRCEERDTAEKVAIEGKTLKGAMDAVMSKAIKAKKGSVAVLTPATVFGAVDAYFGITTDTAAQLKAIQGSTPAPAAAPVPTNKVNLSLEDFL